MWEEAVQVLHACFTRTAVEWQGKYWEFPRAT